PIAETTATTRFPASLAATQRRATRFSRSVSPTEVPPNFITTRPGERGARSTAGIASKSVRVILRQCRCALWGSPTRVRRFAIVLFGVVGLALMPWTVWLSSSLPPHHLTENWDLAWSGFDTVLAASFLLTAFAAWHRRTWLPAAAAATGALLLADAWFDIVLESRSNDFEVAI